MVDILIFIDILQYGNIRDKGNKQTKEKNCWHLMS